MRKYNNSEVMNLLKEFPTLQFKISGDGCCYILKCEGDLVKIFSETGNECGFKIDDEWELIQEPVDFITAMNSGREIRPVGYEHKLIFDTNVNWVKNLSNLNYHDFIDFINYKWEMRY